MIKLLEAEGCSITQVDTLKQTPLYYAAREGLYESMKYLAEGGCAMNNVDTYG